MPSGLKGIGAGQSVVNTEIGTLYILNAHYRGVKKIPPYYLNHYYAD
jgi:hypothetical protein